MKLSKATAYAEQVIAAIVDAARPEQIEVAGSVRRQRPEVGDLDFVILPRDPADVAIIQARFREHCRPDVQGQNYSAYHDANGFRLDVYFATPEVRDLLSVTAGNWGTLLLCRTGSKEFNVWLCDQAAKKGMKWSPNAGLLDSRGGVIASETEESVFKGLGIGWIRPEDRER